MLMIVMQQAENGFYIREEYNDELDLTEEIVHVCVPNFEELVIRLAQVLEIDVNEKNNVLKLIKKKD